MKKPDLTYSIQGFFTAFFPETPEGENAWRTLAEHTEWTGKVFTSQAAGTIAQLRKAGYTVYKARTASDNIDDILQGLGQ